MAVTFPVALPDFFDRKVVVSFTMWPANNRNTVRTGGGSLITSEYGTQFWKGSCRLRILRHIDAEDVLAQVRMLDNARGSFHAGPIHRKLGGIGTPTISAVQNGYELRITGGNAGITIPRGAFLSFNPTTGKRALHQVAETFTTGTGGLSPFFTVTPAILPGWAAGNAVAFNAPSCIAAIVPNSVNAPSVEAVMINGVSFDWEQI